MNMNMNKKVAFALAMMMVAMVAAPAITGQVAPPPVESPPEYTVTVLSGCQVTIWLVNTDFGNILAGNSAELTPTFTLTNEGDWNATVEAKFVTNHSAIWGMQSDGNMIPGTNFGLKLNGTQGYTNLANSDTDTLIPPDVPANNTYSYDAQLTVPASQATGFYNGTIQLTFSNA
jgi:hypothetical protein